MIILGIDPGSIQTGFAVIKADGRKASYLASGVLKFDSKTPFLKRMAEIKIKVAELVRDYKPSELALESLIYVKDPKALMKLSQTRGVIISEALAFCGDKIFEYSPNMVKATVTGHGHADKESVQKTINLVFGAREFTSFDESDALAIALCHALSRQQKIPVVKSPRHTRAKGRGLKASLAHKI